MATSGRERVRRHRQLYARMHGLVRVEAELPRDLVEVLRLPGESTRGMLQRALLALRRQMAAHPERLPDFPLPPTRRRAVRPEVLPETPPPVPVDTATLDAEIRLMAAAGLRPRQIASRLNRAGVPTGTGTDRWDGAAVRVWLARPASHQEAHDPR